jgi:hypothetical protein
LGVVVLLGDGVVLDGVCSSSSAHCLVGVVSRDMLVVKCSLGAVPHSFPSSDTTKNTNG